MFLGSLLLSTSVFGFENGSSLTGTCTEGENFCRSVGSDHCAWWNNPSICNTKSPFGFAAISTHEQSFPCSCGRVDWQQRGMTFTNGKYCTFFEYLHISVFANACFYFCQVSPSNSPALVQFSFSLVYSKFLQTTTYITFRSFCSFRITGC